MPVEYMVQYLIGCFYSMRCGELCYSLVLGYNLVILIQSK